MGPLDVLAEVSKTTLTSAALSYNMHRQIKDQVRRFVSIQLLALPWRAWPDSKYSSMTALNSGNWFLC